MDIIQIPNGNFFPNRNGYTPKWCILHGTAGGTSAEGIATFFKGTEGGNNPVSSHYVIGQDGTVVQCVSEKDGAWANGVLTTGHDDWWPPSINPNNITISIEHCKPSSDNSDVLTPAQEAASFALIADICKRNGIPARAADGNGGITGHYSLDPVRRARCPGTYNWAGLWAYLQGGTPGTPSGWKDDGTALLAPNGVAVVHGFRAAILANRDWDPGNTPCRTEYGANPVLLHNPSVAGGSRQEFRDGLYWWTSAKGVVWEPYIGLELYAAYLALSHANSSTPVVASAANNIDSAIAALQGARKKLSS